MAFQLASIDWNTFRPCFSHCCPVTDVVKWSWEILRGHIPYHYVDYSQRVIRTVMKCGSREEVISQSYWLKG